ncbi:uncharacterized protein LOC124369922 isoform X2 [Homalodisca vitripennis]|uniref:uncharacterized protein LOC124369922 isoform X2 n=1 Tax=Homalodisca vitripennis TaxID=197043 RepID=UPI001EEA0C92|nr:uncharacterized protein LOC124369922 isoform X2 [Homalodisca vitripennis]
MSRVEKPKSSRPSGNSEIQEGSVAKILASRGVTMTRVQASPSQQNLAVARQNQFVPQGRSVGRRPPPLVDLAKDTPTPSKNYHLNRGSRGSLPYQCNVCNAQYPTLRRMLLHKQTFHKEAQGSEMALPVVDMKQPGISQKLSSLGIRHCLVVANSSGGLFGLPIVPIDNIRNQAVCNLGALGASNVLNLGPTKTLSQ